MVENIDNIRKEIQEYIEVKLDLVRLHTAEHLSKLISNASTLAIAGYLLFFILLFLSFAAGFFLGSLLHSNEAGFLCVAGFYILVLIVFLIFRKQIVERPVIQAIVRFLFPKFNDDEKKQ
jgi:hypothetical protein